MYRTIKTSTALRFFASLVGAAVRCSMSKERTGLDAAALCSWSGCPLGAERVDALVPAEGNLLIKLRQDRAGATSTPHQPANAGFA
jgi:hypothetical protein